MKKVTIGAYITVCEPSSELRTWCETNLKIRNPEYAKKLRMGLWLGNTPEYISMHEEHGERLVLPYGCLKLIMPYIAGYEVVKEFPEAVHIDYSGKEIPLYDYQREAVEAAKKGQCGILQSRAGSGKTQMGIALIRSLGKRALWLCHTLDLVKQSKERAEMYFDKGLIGTISEGKVQIGEGVTFATVQTMARLDLMRYKDMWDVIIVDECHRAAGTPTRVTQYSKVLGSLCARHKYGLSATVHRADGMIMSMHALLGGIVHAVPDEAVADKVMQVGIKRTGTGCGISLSCLNSDGTLDYMRLIQHICTDRRRSDTIARYIIAERDKPCLILSDRLAHLESLMERLPSDMREKAVMISGKMQSKRDKQLREQAISDMRSGVKKYLFATYPLAKEGLDIPCLERLFLTTPQKDYVVITQSIGRIARICEGKADPVCYDFVDDIDFFKRMYKKRQTIYRKNNCKFLEDGR